MAGVAAMFMEALEKRIRMRRGPHMWVPAKRAGPFGNGPARAEMRIHDSIVEGNLLD
jgi:hypothetical protein